MEITQETVRKMAHLSRLQIEAARETELVKEISQIVTWMQKLDEIDTQNVEPLIHISQEINKLRDDVASQTLSVKEALQNAPAHDTDYLRVPKVIE